jgi:hypothetical protein
MRFEDTLRPMEVHAVDSQTNATATAQVTARATLSFYVTGFSFSANGTPAAAVQVELREGVSPLARYEVPASAFAPVIVMLHDRPIEVKPGFVPSIVMPALGAAIRGTVTLHGFYSQPSR